MISLGIGTLRWGLLMALLPAWLATQAHAVDPSPPPPSAGAAAPAAAAPPAAAPAAPAAEAPAAAPAPPSPAGAPPADAAGGAAAGADGAYTVRLRSLEKNVNELKEQIFRTKARLNLLKETVLGGV